MSYRQNVSCFINSLHRNTFLCYNPNANYIVVDLFSVAEGESSKKLWSVIHTPISALLLYYLNGEHMEGIT